MSLNRFNLTQVAKWVLFLGVFVIIAMIVFVAYYLNPKRNNEKAESVSEMDLSVMMVEAEEYIKEKFGIDLAALNRKYNLHKNTSDLAIHFIGWSDNRKSFWFSVTVFPGPGLHHLFKLNVANNELTHYDLLNLNIAWEYDFNRDLKILVFSDYPATYDNLTALENLRDYTKITLYLYDIDTRDKTALAISRSGPLEPKWIDNNTIEHTEYPFESEILSELLELVKKWLCPGCSLSADNKEEMTALNRMETLHDNWIKNRQRKRIKI